MIEDFRFSTTLRVRLSETDAFGVVYYANYLTYFDVVTFEYLRALELFGLFDPAGGRTHVIAHAEADYRAPARFDEELTVAARVAAIGTTSYTMAFRIVRGADLLAEGRKVHAVIEPGSWKKLPVPEEFRRRVEEFEA